MAEKKVWSEKKNFLFDQNKLSVMITFNLIIGDRPKRPDILIVTIKLLTLFVLNGLLSSTFCHYSIWPLFTPDNLFLGDKEMIFKSRNNISFNLNKLSETYTNINNRQKFELSTDNPPSSWYHFSRNRSKIQKRKLSKKFCH